MDCATLSSRTDFASYIALLQNATDGEFSLVQNCRAEVCGALWGSGNPDVSGIGMAVGYLLETSICFTLLCASLWMELRPPKRSKLAGLLLVTASRAFYDNAVFFTFAIQIASIITLTKVDFGVSASGMGALTMEIVWIVSTLTILPLLLLVLRPELYESGSRRVGLPRKESVTAGTVHGRTKEPGVLSNERTSALAEARQDVRFLLFVVCWAMGFCPFLSRMGAAFGESRIGDAEGSAISTIDWSRIENVCFQGVQQISVPVRNLITACGIASYLVVSIVVIGKILATVTQDYQARWLIWLRKRYSKNGVLMARFYRALCVVIFVLLVIHFWAFFRLHRLQRDTTQAAGGDFPDEQWTFGQIVAVTVYVSVFVEVAFSWRKRSLYSL